MPRPFKCRHICGNPQADYFKPRGIPLGILEEVALQLDELEAIRLADLEGMYQEEAAAKMKISRQTFGNIIGAAHRKIADALVNAKAVKMEGGEVTIHRAPQDRGWARGSRGRGVAAGRCGRGL